MSPDRMSATSVAHKSTGGTLQSLPEPVDPVGDAPDYLTFKTVAPLHHPVRQVLASSENRSKSAQRRHLKALESGTSQRKSEGGTSRLQRRTSKNEANSRLGRCRRCIATSSIRSYPGFTELP